jgi:hypothetical protein
MNTGPHDELARGLEREADQFARRGGTTHELSQVLDRAGEIRRGRRMRATMVMAACVLAIAVPTVLVAVNRDTTHEPTPAPAPKVDSSPITLAGLKTGAEPKTGWVEANVWHGPDGREYTWNLGRVTGVATVGDALLVATSGPQGQQANLVPPVGDAAQPVTSWPMEGDFAVSPGGRVGAFVKPDGTPMVIQDSGGTADTLPKIPRGSAFDVVAVTGEECQAEGPHTCDVLVTTHGEKPESWVSTSTGHVGAYEQLSNVVAAFGNKLVAGFTEITDTGSCSVVENVEHVESGSPSWTTCEHRLLSFSPDGKLVLASAAYADGAGDSQLTVLDSATGRVVLDLRTTDSGFLTHMVWEDDSNLLAVMGEGRRAAILRIGLDGSREYAVPPAATDPYESPFVLPSR